MTILFDFALTASLIPASFGSGLDVEPVQQTPAIVAPVRRLGSSNAAGYARDLDSGELVDVVGDADRAEAARMFRERDEAEEAREQAMRDCWLEEQDREARRYEAALEEAAGRYGCRMRHC